MFMYINKFVDTVESTISSVLQLDVLDGIYKITAEMNIKCNASTTEQSYNSIIYNCETYRHLMECFRQQSGSSIYQQTYSTATSNVIHLFYLLVK